MRTRLAWIIGAWWLTACTNPVGDETLDLDGGGAAEHGGATELGELRSVVQMPEAPDARTLCAIKFYASELADAVAILGDAGSRTQSSADQVQLIYEYAGNALLRLTFSDVLIDAAVYNMPYPHCWTEDKQAALMPPGQEEI